mgnify:CR=1 FL=1
MTDQEYCIATRLVRDLYGLIHEANEARPSVDVVVAGVRFRLNRLASTGEWRASIYVRQRVDDYAVPMGSDDVQLAAEARSHTIDATLLQLVMELNAARAKS